MLLQLLRRLRCWPLLAITAACLVLQEQFPFSNFPMYSSFGRDTYYVYLADGAGEPLATIASFGITTPILKKMYDTELQREVKRLRTRRTRLRLEQKTPVGERVLQALTKPHAASPGGPERPAGLRLYEVNLSVESGRFVRRTELIAQVL